MEDLGRAVSDEQDEPEAAPQPASVPESGVPAHRPLVERLGMASIALVLAVIFGAMSAVSWAGNDPFLAVMAGVGALMTAWAGLITITRG
jgi:homoserine acetyltransferase